jgi:Fur family peroxide stress response transcriptional regulator
MLEVLRQTTSHPTAKWIYDKVRRRLPELSLGTVYRNLALLLRQGHVRKLDFGSSFDRFDARTAPHHHFVCEKCGSVSDVDLPVDNSLTRKLQRATGLDVNRHEIRLYGFCEKCKPRA